MKRLNSLIFLFIFLLCSPIFADSLSKKDLCEVMYQTHSACKSEANKGRFYGNANSCHIFSMKFAFFMFGKMGYSPNLAQLSETLGNICYASCIGSDKLLNTIKANCKGFIKY